MPSILIVDDDADLSAIVARYLESEGFAVARAASAEEAYDVLATRAFDLVLLDINLPGDDGFAACEALRRVSDVPIVFASARTSETDRIVGLDTGGDDYLPKPYSLRELLAHVKALLRRSQGRAGAERCIRDRLRRSTYPSARAWTGCGANSNPRRSARRSFISAVIRYSAW